MSDEYVPRAGCDLCGKYATYDLKDGRLERTEHWCAVAKVTDKHWDALFSIDRSNIVGQAKT
jgi:hypothetical protein